ncbi:MAG: UDP-3-O-(3-hydroxymyristoyl)glucosamine N-acyltransferase [Rhodobacterales bacterium]|nr:UDP-3-O-(3-hydroxymyristoyl)glucosamine N-acyltransferase [Rhodobacterales bacterium]
MELTIGNIAQTLGAMAAGDLSLIMARAAEPSAAGPDDLAIALSPAYAAALPKGRARAAVVWPGADWQALGLQAAIFAPRGRLALSRLTGLLDPAPDIAPGIHPTVILDPTATIAEDVAIGPYCVIGAGVTIGGGTKIDSHVTIGIGSLIGGSGLIHAGVRIGRHVRIGDRAIIQPNAVIGADGFSFVTATPSSVERAKETMGKDAVTAPDDPTWYRIHSLGGVWIGDDVEIGSGTTVDAGTIRATRIGNGTKIDNMVMVAHNAIIGENCLLAGHSGVAGSGVLGDRVVLGGKSGVADNTTVGSDVVLTGGTLALSNVPSGRVMMGYPATKMETQVETYKALRRLPRILRDLGARQKAVPNAGESD